MPKVLFVFFLILFAWACKGDIGPAGPILSGNIAGLVSLVGLAGEQLKNKSGVTVSIGDQLYTATTTADGEFQLVNVLAGIYDLKFSKTGFFVEKTFNVQFVGGGTLYLSLTRMEQISSSSVTRLTVTPIDSTHSIRFEGSIAPRDPLGRYVIVALSKSQLTNTIPFECPRIVYISTYGDSTFKFDFSTDYLIDFTKGDTLNAMAFYGGFGDAGINYDPATRQIEFSTPGVNLSNIVTFVVP